jgi:hypothetical protein
MDIGVSHILFVFGRTVCSRWAVGHPPPSYHGGRKFYLGVRVMMQLNCRGSYDWLRVLLRSQPLFRFFEA